MDTSKEYIKMCGKATDVQELRPVSIDWELGDYYSFEDGDFGVTGVPNGYDDYFIKHHQGEIWLPRQDQLQEMVECWTTNPVEKILRFAQGVYTYPQLEETEENQRYYFKFSSMEQLWLAFVMKEKYGKTWNGEEWT